MGRTTTSKKSGFSEREWPISGGEWSPASCSYSEIVITGHQDGSLKFWDSGAGTLQVLFVFMQYFAHINKIIKIFRFCISLRQLKFLKNQKTCNRMRIIQSIR